MPPRSSARKRAADGPPDEVLRRYVCIYPSAGYRQLADLDNIDFTRDYLRTFLRNNRAAVVESFEASWASMPTLQLAELQRRVEFLRGYVDDGAATALRALQHDHGESASLADVQSILDSRAMASQPLGDAQSIGDIVVMAMKRHVCIYPTSGYRRLCDTCERLGLRTTVA